MFYVSTNSTTLRSHRRLNPIIVSSCHMFTPVGMVTWVEVGGGCYKRKCTSSYPMMNSLLCSYSQLHQPRFYIQFVTQTTLIHQFMTNIAIIISRDNQNRNNLITNLNVHLNDRFLMVYLFVIQCCINTRNDLTNIPNILCILCIIFMRHYTPILGTIPPRMISSILYLMH